MLSLLFFTVSGYKKAPSPAGLLAGPKGRSRINHAPRYHPDSARSPKAAAQRSNAGNGAYAPSRTTWPRPFARAARERTSAALPPEALSAGEASLCAVPMPRTFSVIAFAFIQGPEQGLCYHIFRRFASAAGQILRRSAPVCKNSSEKHTSAVEIPCRVVLYYTRSFPKYIGKL